MAATRLERRLNGHALQETLTSLRSALDSLSDDAVAASDEAGPEGTIQRASKVLDYVEGLLSTADPHLITQATLDGLHGPMDQALTAVNNIAADPSGSTTSLDQALENALQQVTPVAAAAKGFVQQTQKVGRKLGGALGVKVKELEGEADMIAEELAQLESRRRTGLEEWTAEQQEKHDNLETRLGELQTAIDTEKQRVDSVASEFQDRFEGDQQERSTKFEETLQSIGEKAEAETEDIKQQGRKTLAAAEGVRDKISELYRVVTDTSTAGAFHKEAGTEGSAADHWRLIAIGLGVTAAVIAVVSVAISIAFDPSPAVVFTKIAATVAVSILAAYAGRESAHHRKRANQAKDLELELIAIEGFLFSVDPGEQRELRKGYFERAFRGRSAPETPASTESLDAGPGLLTPEILHALAALAKAVQTRGS